MFFPELSERDKIFAYISGNLFTAIRDFYNFFLSEEATHGICMLMVFSDQLKTLLHFSALGVLKTTSSYT